MVKKELQQNLFPFQVLQTGENSPTFIYEGINEFSFNENVDANAH